MKARWLPRTASAAASPSGSSVSPGPLHEGLESLLRVKVRTRTQEGQSIGYPSVFNASLRHPGHRRVYPTAQFTGR